MSPEANKSPESTLPELTPEQWESGKEIAEFCDLGNDVLEQKMLWGGVEASVGYGLAHSAHHMGPLTPTEIRNAVFKGIADYQASLPNPDEAN